MRAAHPAGVFAEPTDDAERLTEVWAGELVDVHERRGDWMRVTVPGQPSSRDPGGYPGWLRVADLAEPGPAAVLDVARTYLDVPYRWGGLSHDGIDCSGLVHACFRALGVTVPRDAFDQADAATRVPLGEEQPGDLYFFARPGKRIHHVGFVVAPGVMLHAPDSGDRRYVVEEELPQARRETLVAVGRVVD